MPFYNQTKTSAQEEVPIWFLFPLLLIANIIVKWSTCSRTRFLWISYRSRLIIIRSTTNHVTQDSNLPSWFQRLRSGQIKNMSTNFQKQCGKKRSVAHWIKKPKQNSGTIKSRNLFSGIYRVIVILSERFRVVFEIHGRFGDLINQKSMHGPEFEKRIVSGSDRRFNCEESECDLEQNL